MKSRYIIRAAATWLVSLTGIALAVLVDRYIDHAIGLASTFLLGAAWSPMRAKLDHWALYNEWPWKKRFKVRKTAPVEFYKLLRRGSDPNKILFHSTYYESYAGGERKVTITTVSSKAHVTVDWSASDGFDVHYTGGLRAVHLVDTVEEALAATALLLWPINPSERSGA